MSRLTGNDAKSLMEAYASIYVPQELTEEQVWEEVENWVNSLLEEGYDLSEYTWEEMYESYISEAPLNTKGFTFSRGGDRPTLAGAGGDPRVLADRLGAYHNALTGGPKPTLAGAGGDPRVFAGRLGAYRSGLLAKPAAPAPRQQALAPRQQAPAPAPGPQTVAAAGGAGGRVTVGTQYAATQNGVPGNVTYGPDGRKTFTPNRPAATTVPPGGPRTASTSDQPPPPPPVSTSSSTPTRPSLQSGIGDLQRMGSASLMRQQGRNLPGGKIPVGADLKPKSEPPPPPSSSGSPNQNPAAASPPPPPAPAPAGPSLQNRIRSNRGLPTLQKSHFDPFDVVIGHLLDEGYADTEEAALKIMAHMSEEWRQSILEDAPPSSSSVPTRRGPDLRGPVGRSALGSGPSGDFGTPMRPKSTPKPRGTGPHSGQVGNERAPWSTGSIGPAGGGRTSTGSIGPAGRSGRRL